MEFPGVPDRSLANRKIKTSGFMALLPRILWALRAGPDDGRKSAWRAPDTGGIMGRHRAVRRYALRRLARTEKTAVAAPLPAEPIQDTL